MQLKSFRLSLMFLLAMFCARGFAGPTTKPTTRTADEISVWFGDLADSDVTVREAARTNLMSMKRSDLSTLKKIVSDNLPIQPAQSAMLREIVTHVYLTEEHYDHEVNNPGFLGVAWGSPDLDLNDLSAGIPIAKLIPGFGGCTVLLEGDLILGIVEQPDLKPKTTREFSDAIRGTPAGTTIHFEILRQGRLMKLPVTLSARPAVRYLEPNSDEFLGSRQQVADDYWRTNFAPLVEGGVS